LLAGEEVLPLPLGAPELLGVLPQGGLGLHALVHVDDAAEPAHDGAVLAAERQRARGDPAVRPVAREADAELARVRCARPDGLVPRGPGGGALLGVDVPRGAADLAGLLAEEGEELGAVVVGDSAAVRGPEHGGALLDEGAEERLPLAQRAVREVDVERGAGGFAHATSVGSPCITVPR